MFIRNWGYLFKGNGFSTVWNEIKYAFIVEPLFDGGHW